MKLHELQPDPESRSKRKRIGRGVGSGFGKTAGRGTKGHNSRSGGGVRPGFEGGQMPIHRRLPKRGFCNIFRKNFAIVNLRDLNAFEDGSLVDEKALVQAGLVRGRRDGIKVLGQGEIEKALTLRVDRISRGAREKIEASGGSVEVI